MVINFPKRPAGITTRLLSLPLFYKILVANSFLILLVLGPCAWIVHRGIGRLGLEVPSLLVLFGILVGSIIVNCVIIHFALSPLEELSTTMVNVASGKFHLRALYHPLGEKMIDQAVGALNRMLDALEKERERSGRQAKLILFAQEEERKRIARELHDDASQVLAAVLLGFADFKKRIPDATLMCGALKEDMDRISGMTEKAMTALLRLAFDLRPSVLDDIGLKQALTSLLREQVDTKEMLVSFTCSGPDTPLPDDVQISLFRVAQEAITNTIKYAKARTVTVSLERNSDSTILTIEDDGTGFDLGLLSGDRERHQGIHGMQERIALLGGELKITSAPGKGTRIYASVPVRAQ